MKNNQIPEVRFPEFKDAWELRKLGGILKVNSGRDYKHLNDGNIPVYGTGGYMLSVDAKLSDHDAIGIGRKGTIDKPQYLKAPFWTVDTLFYLTPLKDNELKFIHQVAYKINWKKYAEQTGVPSLSKVSIEKIETFVPNKEEQHKIGAFFKQIDDTIALHQRKLDLLKEQKKGFLQKMFPKNGQAKPKIRFSGFTDDWELRKLKDIANFIRGSFPQPYTNPEWYDEKNGKPFVQVADIGFDLKLNKDTKAHISKVAEAKSRFVEKGKVIVALQGSIEKSIGRVAITQYSAFFDRTILIFESYKEEIDNQYFAQVIQNLFQIEKEKAWGATISTITKEAVSSFIIGLPNIEEQKKIGIFFKQLDDTIALHQRELEILKNTKKAFLQKMFV